MVLNFSSVFHKNDYSSRRLISRQDGGNECNIENNVIKRDCYVVLLILGTLRSDDGDGNGNATSLISKTTILHVHHAFFVHFFAVLHHSDVKMPNFTMYRGNTQATTKFPLSF